MDPALSLCDDNVYDVLNMVSTSAYCNHTVIISVMSTSGVDCGVRCYTICCISCCLTCCFNCCVNCCINCCDNCCHSQGALRVSRFNPFEGWVGSESVGQDILISGRVDMNRLVPMWLMPCYAMSCLSFMVYNAAAAAVVLLSLFVQGHMLCH